MKTMLQGFGGGVSAACDIVRPANEEEVASELRKATREGRQIVLRGAGRSYGDASIGEGMTALSLEKLNTVINFDPESGLIEVQAGMSLLHLCQFALHHGFWPPVVSGTCRTTVAGAIAMNIHGKSQWKDGCFIEHVKSLVMIPPEGSPLRFDSDGHGFDGIAGSLGLFGAVTRVTIQLKKVKSPLVYRQRLPARNWTDLFHLSEALTKTADSFTAWIDGFTDGVSTAEPAFNPTESSPVAAQQVIPTGPDPKGLAAQLGPLALRWMLNCSLLKQTNSFRRFLAAREREKAIPVDLYKFNFQLDWLWDWDRAFRPGSLVQFQSGIPAAKASVTFEAQVDLCRKKGLPPTLLVMKRHRPGTGSLDYLCDGWSLAIDLHQKPGDESKLRDLYGDLTEMTIAAGGRIYLAKDFLLTADQHRRMVRPEEFEEFKRHRSHFDPGGILSSGLAKRLDL